MVWIGWILAVTFLVLWLFARNDKKHERATGEYHASLMRKYYGLLGECMAVGRALRQDNISARDAGQELNRIQIKWLT